MPRQPQQDPSTVTPDGKRKMELIDGVILRPAITHIDERGSVCEIFNKDWPEYDHIPLVFVYQVTVRPGKIKGWTEHRTYHDRLMVTQGYARIVLYDNRPDSPTHTLINEIMVSELNRTLLVIPPFVYHAVQNIGDKDIVFINTPGRAYDHEDPDKYRLPFDNDLIPFDFNAKPQGW